MQLSATGKAVFTAMIAAALAVPAPIARAGELVTLNNGFTMRCDHHARVEDRVRLYLSSGEDNYVELEPGKIAGVELVPDPTPELAATARPGLRAKLTTADVGEMLATAGKEHNLDVDLLAAVVKAESNGNALAVSHAGARGLMQLMPGTANDLGVKDSFEPRQNVRGGSAYLDELLSRYRDNLALALAAYNAGPAAVDKYHGIPPYHETRAYVARVIHEFNRLVLSREAQAQSHALSSASPQTTSR